MTGFDLVVRGGAMPVDDEMRTTDLGIRDGRIVARADPGELSGAAETLDADGAWILPGAVDAHVHAGAPFCDDVRTAAASAITGGVTTLGWYAYPPDASSWADAAHGLTELSTGNAADIVVHWRLDRDGPVDEQVAAAVAVGITSFKVFMAYRDRGLQWSDAAILEAMAAIAAHGGLLAVHAEWGDVIHHVDQRGDGSLASWLAAREPMTEAEAVRRALLLARVAGCRILIPHVTSAAALDAYLELAQTGATLIETCPQYLLLDATALEGEQGALAKVGPPLRHASDTQALAEAVIDGRIDLVGSDHAPFPADAKEGPFVEAPHGMPGVATLLSLMLDRFGPVVTQRVCAAGPAAAMSLSGRKGSLDIGCDADFVVVDPDSPRTLRADELGSNAGYTPFEGTTVAASVVSVWRAGRRLDAASATGVHLARTTTTT